MRNEKNKEMNINQKKSGFKAHFLLLLQILFGLTNFANAEPSDNIFKKSVQLSALPEITYDLYDVTIEVVPVMSQELKIEMEYLVDGKAEEVDRLKTLIEETVLKGQSGGSSAKVDLSFQNNFDLEIMGMKWSKLTFKSGAKETIKLKEFKVKRCRVWMPAKANVNLNVKYSTISIGGDIKGNCKLDIYDSKVVFGNVTEALLGEAKYSTLDFGSSRTCHLNFYECKVSGKVQEACRFQAKYTTLKLDEVNNLELDMYEGSCYIKDITTGNITSKYASIDIQKASDLELTAYEGSLVFDRVVKVLLNAKYLDLKGEQVDLLEMREAYENELTVGVVGSVISLEGKYNEFNIVQLNKSFVQSGYEDEIEINKVSTNFEKISLDGKYIESKIGLPIEAAFSLKGKVQYPDFSVNEGACVIRKKIGDDNQLEFHYDYHAVNESTPVINVNGYEIKFAIVN